MRMYYYPADGRADVPSTGHPPPSAGIVHPVDQQRIGNGWYILLLSRAYYDLCFFNQSYEYYISYYVIILKEHTIVKNMSSYLVSS